MKQTTVSPSTYELEKFLFHTLDEDQWKTDPRFKEETARELARKIKNYQTVGTWKMIKWDLN